jgi:hypothetical protein
VDVENILDTADVVVTAVLAAELAKCADNRRLAASTVVRNPATPSDT